MRKSKLDKEEAGILQDFGRGELKRVRDVRREKRALEQAAANTLRTDKRITVRLSSRDLERIQKRAAREGIPYQTLISGTLHKFANGRFKDVG
ncbi:MAG: antitoxin [Phycisphaerae bacterium]|nr:antitoxin [Phycisphaerae bacterium]